MYQGFDEIEKQRDELVALPRDELEPFEVHYAKIAYQPAIDGVSRVRRVIDDRKTKKFADYLGRTLEEFKSGSWRNDEFYSVTSEGFVKCSMSEKEIIDTLDYYALKLSSASSDRKYSDLIGRVSIVTGKDYYLASRSSH